MSHVEYKAPYGQTIHSDTYTLVWGTIIKPKCLQCRWLEECNNGRKFRDGWYALRN